MLKRVTAVAGAAALMLASQAQAALATYSTQSSFEGALVTGSVRVENLDAILPFESATAGLNLVFEDPTDIGNPLKQIGAKLLGPDQTRNDANSGRHAESGAIYFEGGQSPFEITFGAAVHAFGFWGSDIGDFKVDTHCSSTDPNCVDPTDVLKIEFFSSAGGAVTETRLLKGASSDGSDIFYGFADAATAYEKVRITNLTAIPQNPIIDGQGFDTFMIGAAKPDGNPAPEPGALALAGIGLLAAAIGRRRTR